MKEEIKQGFKGVEERVKGLQTEVAGLVKRLEAEAADEFRDAAIGGLKTALDKLPEFGRRIVEKAVSDKVSEKVSEN